MMRTLCTLVALALAGIFASNPALAADRPNILWLTSEDHGPHMGCYGDPLATTPNIDALARRGMIYTRVWSNAPVCAPARTTLISGMYATSLGGEHMRSLVPYPAGLKMFPQLLREAGYYCANNAKEDYNVAKPGQVWDASSRQAHWRNRKAGQPFFAVFNSEKSHESQIRTRPHKLVHDPARVRIPAYHPDTPEVRHDWAQYYDGVSNADADAGVRLKQLEADGLLDDTIIFYFADHGSGMPRNKRSPCDSGLHVPLVIVIPEKWRSLAPRDYQPGGKTDRLVSFVDFGPTVLSLAGIKPPDSMQGEAFLGEFARQPRMFAYGFRGRMDERYDMIRSVTDGKFVYVRNFMPHRIAGARQDYMFQTPTTQVWKSLHDAGKLNAAQEIFWTEKPAEELFELASDPDEVHNLANSPEQKATLERFRNALKTHVRAIRDVGFLPEGERFERFPKMSPYDGARLPNKYDYEKIITTAELAADRDMKPIPSLLNALYDPDSAVRYWAATGFVIRGKNAVTAHADVMRIKLNDPSPYVQIAASEALARFGSTKDRSRATANLVQLCDAAKHDVFVSITAANSLDLLDRSQLLPFREAIKILPLEAKLPDARYSPYIPRLLGDLKQSLDAK